MAYDPSKWFSYSNLYDKTDASENNSTQQFQHEGPSYSMPSTASFYEPGVDGKSDYVTSSYSNHESFRKNNVDEYDPCAPSLTSKIVPDQPDVIQEKPDPRKLDQYITMLQKMIRPLPHEYKKMLPYDVICQLAHSMLDGTVLDITKGLKDIQKITEKNLSAKRMKLTNEQKAKKTDMLKRHTNEIASSQRRPHQILIIEKNHAEELKIFRQKSEKDIATLDQKLVLDLDQQVSDQQATLERAGLPLFFITNNREEIKLQMYILEFIIKLSASG